MIDYVALKAELDTDPLALGYKNGSGVFKSNRNIADLLNTVPTIPGTGRMINDGRTVIDTWEVIEATVDSEWAALSAQEKQRYQTLVDAVKVNIKGANTRLAFRAIFANGTVSRTNIANLQNLACSRGVFLFNELVIETWDVERARAL